MSETDKNGHAHDQRDSQLNRFPTQHKGESSEEESANPLHITNLPSLSSPSGALFHLKPERNKHLRFVHVHLRPEDIASTLGDGDSE